MKARRTIAATRSLAVSIVVFSILTTSLTFLGAQFSSNVAAQGYTFSVAAEYVNVTMMKDGSVDIDYIFKLKVWLTIVGFVASIFSVR